MKYTNTLIFDLDGTLLDTLLDLVESTNAALKFSKLPERSYDEIKGFIGNGVEMLIRFAVPDNASEDKIQECLAYFKLYYSLNSKKHTKPYDGIIQTLENLKSKGFKIGVVSNKPDKIVKELCTEFFSGLIDIAVGEKFNTEKKPCPDSVLQVMKDLEADADKTVMVGDSEIDIETAKNAKIYSIGVLWGYRDEKVLVDAGADELVDSPERLEFVL